MYLFVHYKAFVYDMGLLTSTLLIIALQDSCVRAATLLISMEPGENRFMVEPLMMKTLISHTGDSVLFPWRMQVRCTRHM